MSAHTPGPWMVRNLTDVFSALGADSGDGLNADANDGWHIADCCIGKTFVDGELTELGPAIECANARLIAAAPDLLAVVDAMVAMSQKGFSPSVMLDENSPLMDAARDALRKAGVGEQS